MNNINKNTMKDKKQLYLNRNGDFVKDATVAYAEKGLKIHARTTYFLTFHS